MEVKNQVSINKEFRIGDIVGVVVNVKIHSIHAGVSKNNSDRIENAINIFFNSVTEIMESTNFTPYLERLERDVTNG